MTYQLNTIIADTVHTAVTPVTCTGFDIAQAIEAIGLINHTTKVEALTVFNSITKIMSVDDALNTVIKMRKSYLDKKNYKPYVDSDGRYRCYVYWEEDGKKKRKPIAAKSIMDLEKKALDFYEGLKKASTPTLANIYPIFIKERVEDGVGDSTIRHDQYDWIRYLQDDELSQRSLADIAYHEFVSWFKRKLKRGLQNKRTGEIKPYTPKQAKGLRSLLSNLFQFAVDRGIIEENFCTKLGRFPYKKYCVEAYKPDSDQVYQDDEPTKIMELAFNKFYSTHNFAYLAVIMNFLLDLRVGELVALKFSDIDDKPGQIHIQCQEVENFIIDPATGVRHRNGFKLTDHTKTWEDRFVNLSDVAEQLLRLIKEEQQKMGIESEFLFINKKNERMHACSITKVLYEVLNPGINTSHKSCHKIRKTVTSNLRNALGVAVAARVAGHKNESTTDKHYSYSTVSNEYYKEEYTKVIDEKVPEILKSKLVCSN